MIAVSIAIPICFANCEETSWPRARRCHLEQLSKTYAHLLPDSADRTRVALDAYLSQAADGAESVAP